MSTLIGINNNDNKLYGYGNGSSNVHGTLIFSNNVIVGGDNLAGNTSKITNILIGGAYCMYDTTISQHNTLKGGNCYSTFNDGSNYLLWNSIQGSAGTMFGSSSGGYNTLTGGDAKNAAGSFIWNTLMGTAYVMTDSSTGGHNTITGGNNLSATGLVTNYLYGDAYIKQVNASGGYNTIIAGTGINGNKIVNQMWGDAKTVSGTSTGGHDLFIFDDNGTATVGNQNYINDFSQALSDHIEFIDITGVNGFSNLVITKSGSNTIINAGSDAVTLTGFTGTLQASDFIFATSTPTLTPIPTVIGINNQDNVLYGYGNGNTNVIGNLVFSNNVIKGGDLTGVVSGAPAPGSPSTSGTMWNDCIGGAYCMFNTTTSQHNTLTGGSAYTTFHSPVSSWSILNEMMGSAGTMFGSSSGGYNILIGGDAKNTNGSYVSNYLRGTAFAMTDSSTGGHNTITGGNNLSATSGLVTNYLYGDAYIKQVNASGGYNTLIAGTGINGNNVINKMWGDANTVTGTTTTGGHDIFIFQDNGTARVGTQNYINDFSQAISDHIEFSHVAGVTGFSNLVITQSSGNTIIHAGNDAVTLVGFAGTLNASDFIFV